jgi:ornithine carbamoyltransferase
MLGSAKLGINVRIATPKGYECDASIMAKTQELAKENGTSDVFVTNVAEEAVKGSDVVVTDTCKLKFESAIIPLFMLLFIYSFIHLF